MELRKADGKYKTRLDSQHRDSTQQCFMKWHCSRRHPTWDLGDEGRIFMPSKGFWLLTSFVRTTSTYYVLYDGTSWSLWFILTLECSILYYHLWKEPPRFVTVERGLRTRSINLRAFGRFRHHGSNFLERCILVDDKNQPLGSSKYTHSINCRFISCKEV